MSMEYTYLGSAYQIRFFTYYFYTWALILSCFLASKWTPPECGPTTLLHATGLVIRQTLSNKQNKSSPNSHGTCILLENRQ